MNKIEKLLIRRRVKEKKAIKRIINREVAYLKFCERNNIISSKDDMFHSYCFLEKEMISILTEESWIVEKEFILDETNVFILTKDGIKLVYCLGFYKMEINN